MNNSLVYMNLNIPNIFNKCQPILEILVSNIHWISNEKTPLKMKTIDKSSSKFISK